MFSHYLLDWLWLHPKPFRKVTRGMGLSSKLSRLSKPRLIVHSEML